jgi:hypothetical protein
VHSAIVVINMPEKAESEGHHPKWLAFQADLCRAAEPIVSSLGRSGRCSATERECLVSRFPRQSRSVRSAGFVRHAPQAHLWHAAAHGAPVWHPAGFHPRLR